MSDLVPTSYLHGSAPAESELPAPPDPRIDAACLGKLRLQGGARILELGSGLGGFARDMARVAGTPVVCVEPAESRIFRCHQLADEARETSLLDVRQGDANALPLRDEEWGSFDLVVCRFVLEQLSRPQPVVESLARALCPGGRLVLADHDHDLLRMWPAMPAVDELWRALIRAFVDRGFDPFVGRKLVAMMEVADLVPAHVDSLFFGGCQGTEEWGAVVDSLVAALVGSRSEILASSAIPSDVFDEVIESLQDWGGRTGSTLWYQVCWAEAVKPE